MAAGYSGTPLVKKLGLRPGARAYIDSPPGGYFAAIEPIPAGVVLLRRPAAGLDFVHLFTTSADDFAGKLARYRDRVRDDGTIWVSWPKRASKVPTDVTEDVVRAAALPLGLVDVKVCAVDDVWSGLKLVVRVENRGRRA